MLSGFTIGAPRSMNCYILDKESRDRVVKGSSSDVKNLRQLPTKNAVLQAVLWTLLHLVPVFGEGEEI